MDTKDTISIKVPVLARVEGEGALDLEIRDQRITSLHLRIFEPPRLFEALLVQRSYHELLDIVARICGICPVAYQMSAARALEDLFATPITPWVEAMRRVYYYGEWIESHALHIHLLAAPDYLGFDNAISMAEKHPELVRRGLRLQALGNRLIKLFGARSVNPIGARIGGFYRAPAVAEVRQIRLDLKTAQEDARLLLLWAAQLELPVYKQDLLFACVNDPGRYPIMGNAINVSDGSRIVLNEFAQHFREQQVAHSTALHCHYRGKPYLVGPLARINLHHEQLHDEVKRTLSAAGIQFPFPNNFYALLARAAEIYHAVLEADQLLQDYQRTASPFTQEQVRAGEAFGCTEAPRGMLWHQYKVDAAGLIQFARIVPPTSQNQAHIEWDIADSLHRHGLNQTNAALKLLAEKVIRNYDPCISCATHFLRLKVARR